MVLSVSNFDILGLIAAVIYLLAAFIFYVCMNRFTAGRFKRFNLIIFASLSVLVVSIILQMAQGYLHNIQDREREELVEQTGYIVELVAGALFLFAAYRLKTMAEQFGFAATDLSAKGSKEPEKRFVDVMVKSKKR